MYIRTTFDSLIKQINKSAFNKIVKFRQGDKVNHIFNAWDHVKTMVYSQVSSNASLREIETGLNNSNSRSKTVSRSTLSRANMQRDYRIFEDLALSLMPHCNRKLRKDAKEIVRLIDSSPIPLSGDKIHSWCRATKNSVKGLKLHIEYDLGTTCPVRSKITGADMNDVSVAQDWDLEENIIYVFDRGYNYYNWWDKIHCMESSFITRPHRTAKTIHISSRKLSDEERELGVVEDGIVHIGNKSNKQNTAKGYIKNKLYKKEMRRIVIKREDKDTDLVLVTNNFELSAQEVGELYKRRWAIELYFKWIKQSLKIKKFMGHSENATKIQIYTALIVQLLLSLFREITKMTKYSLKHFLDLVRTILFLDCSNIGRVRDKDNPRKNGRFCYMQKEMNFNLGH